ncbi:hypothetical protein [Gracilimonas sp.]|uniref:hypothetical protein n=1 Tax=Gracilimonas sp. TaxID=1974203 RepID=UPI0028726D90|nr:hypothetical protein [Gracilimonas sp.]
MPYFTKAISLIAISTLITISACAPTETVTLDESVAEAPTSQKYPGWYNSSGFLSDSLSYHAFGTAISSDSVIAIANAKLQANAVLEDHIAELLEDAREDMEEVESEASETAFIIQLRIAHGKVEENTTTSETFAKFENGEYYRGYSQVTLSKEQLFNLLESGFEGESRYWELIANSELFIKALK